jgi:hypothetical protein
MTEMTLKIGGTVLFNPGDPRFKFVSDERIKVTILDLKWGLALVKFKEDGKIEWVSEKQLIILDTK